MTPPVTVALLLKVPIPGTVKTRLARAVGADMATTIYKRLVRHQIAQIPAGWGIVVHFSPADELERMHKFLGEELTYVAQPEGDLGKRLCHATAHHFEKNSHPLLVIGGDCPYLTTAVLTACAASLSQRQVCLVPALDGGYVMIGLAENTPVVFEDIEWSTPKVHLQTVRRCLSAGLTLQETHPALEDIDHLDAWQRALASVTMQTQPTVESTSTAPPPASAATARR